MSWLTETLNKIAKSYEGLNTSSMQGAGSMGLQNIERTAEKMNPEEAKEFKQKAKANLVTGTMLAPAVPLLVNGFATAPVTTALELVGGTAAGTVATLATDKAIEKGSDGKYTGFTDYITKKFPDSNPYIVEQFHPAGWIGGLLGGWGTRNAFLRTPRGKVELVNSELSKNISNTKLSNSYLDDAVLSGKVGWGPNQIIHYRHGSYNPNLSKFEVHNTWDVTNHNASPFKWFGTEVSSPKNMMDDRPYQYIGLTEIKKPMTQLGEYNIKGKNDTRNYLVAESRQRGADAYYLQGIADNKAEDQNVLIKFLDHNGESGGFGIKPSKLTEAERLGIPKGDRNNLSESQQEAVRDLYHYITNGKFRQNFLYDPKVGFYWGSTKPTVNTGGYRQMLTDPKATIRIFDDNTGFVCIPTETGTLTYFPQYNNTSLSISMPKTEINKAGFGNATATAQGRFGKSVILTPPKIDALSEGVHIEGLSSTIPKKQVYDFYKVLTSSSKPGTYVSGDAAAPPLGWQAIVDYANGNSTKAVSTILSGETPTLTASSRTGLSPDSYISLLKQGNRPEWRLSFNRKQGFAKWNDTAVNNSEIYNAWKAAKNGTIEQKQAYIKLFNDWVAPYNGAKAYLNDKGVIIHPHPFIVRQKQGGSIHIKEKNKGKFTESAKRAGKSVQEHARDVVNNPKATKLQKKRAQFALNVKKFKH